MKHSQLLPVVAVLLFSAANGIAEFNIKAGDPIEKVVSIIGSPTGKAKMGNREIYIYEAGKVIFQNGKVIQVPAAFASKQERRRNEHTEDMGRTEQWMRGNDYLTKAAKNARYFTDAAKWFRLSAEKGFPASQWRLGQLYIHGAGVPKDCIQAYAWLTLSAQQGWATANHDKQKLCIEMLPEQINEANRLAAEYSDKYAYQNSSAPIKTGPAQEMDTLYARLIEDIYKQDEHEPTNGCAKAARNSTVYIGRDDGGHGTGFLISDDGYLLTNWHVIAGCLHLKIQLANGQTLPFNHVVCYSVKHDLALLKVSAKNQPYLKPIFSKSLDQGSTLFAMGHPYNSKWILSEGNLAGWRYENKSQRKCVQFSADISPGNSGGPIFDKHGRFCAVATYYELHKLPWQGGSKLIDPTRVFKFGVASEDIINLPLTGSCDRCTLSEIQFLKTTIDQVEVAQAGYCLAFELLTNVSKNLKSAVKIHEKKYYKYDKKGVIRDENMEPVIWKSYTVEVPDDSIYDDLLQLVTLRNKVIEINKSFPKNSSRHACGAINCLTKGIDQKLTQINTLLKTAEKTHDECPSIFLVKRQSKLFSNGLSSLRTEMRANGTHLLPNEFSEKIKQYF